MQDGFSSGLSRTFHSGWTIVKKFTCVWNVIGSKKNVSPWEFKQRVWESVILIIIIWHYNYYYNNYIIVIIYIYYIIRWIVTASDNPLRPLQAVCLSVYLSLPPKKSQVSTGTCSSSRNLHCFICTSKETIAFLLEKIALFYKDTQCFVAFSTIVTSTRHGSALQFATQQSFFLRVYFLTQVGNRNRRRRDFKRTSKTWKLEALLLRSWITSHQQITP